MEPELQGDESDHLQPCQSCLHTPRWDEGEFKILNTEASDQERPPFAPCVHPFHPADRCSSHAAALDQIQWLQLPQD